MKVHNDKMSMAWTSLSDISGFWLLLAFFTLTLLFSGCATPPKYENHNELFSQGLYLESAQPFEKEMAERKEDGSDARKYVLDDMCLGAAYRAAGKREDSVNAFERAEQGIKAQQEQSTLGNALRQVGAVFANDNALPYQVQEYDGIMVNTYKALDILEQGEIDKARVEFNRVAERQRMAAVRFEKEIAKDREDKAKADAEAKARQPQDTSDSSLSLKERVKKMVSENFSTALGISEGALGDKGNIAKLGEYKSMFSADTWGAQDAFTNPFSTYMEGLFLFLYGEDHSDLEQSVKFFETACHQELNSEINPAAKAYTLANDVADSKMPLSAIGNKVWVIFENGLCPEKQEYKLPLIVPLNMKMNSDQGFIESSLTLPILVARSDAYPYLGIYGDGREIGKTSMLCNMDAVVISEFRKRLPGIITRNVIQTTVKDVLQVIIIEKLKEQGVPKMLSSAALSALFDATKHADTRIWSSLPKNFQVAVVDRPESGRLDFAVPGTSKPIASENIPSGGPSIVLVKIPAPGVRPVCSVISNKAGFEKLMRHQSVTTVKASER